MKEKRSVVLKIESLGFPWQTQDPFLFCVYHADAYPVGNAEFGPDASLKGRQLGNDFAIKDGWRMYHGRKVPGFPVHPHRGFETVTVVRKGMVDHSDSLGGAGRYGHGDVQWMTAGKGIQHAEMFPLLNQDGPNTLELFQIWLNLPRAGKMVDPFYTMLWKEDISEHVHLDETGLSTRVEVVAGSLGEVTAPDPAPNSWAADGNNEVAIWYVEMEAGAKWELPSASPGINRNLYFFEGEHIQLNMDSIPANKSISLAADRDVSIHNGTATGRFLLLQGRPIAETVVSYGPFVMNSREEIQRTYQDYQQNQFGGWPWPRPDMIHDAGQGRFALYPDGREELPPKAL
jgi:redox-sensitive bicupin YhaK (pirin superfamily)